MDDLLDEFIAEVRDMLAALAGEVVAWEADPSDRERLDAIFRFAHTVKGNCGFFDFPHLEQLSHAAEDALSDCRAGRRQPDAALVSAVLAIIDRIGAWITAIEAGEALDPGADGRLITALGVDSGKAGPLEPRPVAETHPESASNADQLGASARPGVQRTIRVPVNLLDRVMSGVSDMAMVRNDLARRMLALGEGSDLHAPFARLSAVLADLSEAITSIRMQPIDTLFAGFPRLARDLAHDLGKAVRVEIESGDVEIDRELIEVVRDPLVHVIRNAVDHGIETPQERRAAGKPETGTITISARQTGSEIRVGIFDDGRGIDTARLAEKAVAAGLLSQSEVSALSERQRTMLVCESGLSTANSVTAVSGRGVGMDVVRANIEKIGGKVMIDSTPGVGTRMMIDIPMTLSIVPSITLTVGDDVFALPRSYVEEIVHLSAKKIPLHLTGGRRFIPLRGQDVPVVGLGEVLGIRARKEPEKALYVLIKLVGGDVFGLGVDEVIDHEELVVAPLAPLLMQCGFYVGSTQLDDGRPIPMLDAAGVARAAGMVGEVKMLRVSDDAREGDDAETETATALLFVGFDGQERAIAMEAVRRIEKLPATALRRGDFGADHIAIEGRIVPLLELAGELDTDKIAMFSVGEGDVEIAYAYRRMIDLVTYDAATVTSTADTRVALIGSRPVELLDEDMLNGRRAVSAAHGA